MLERTALLVDGKRTVGEGEMTDEEAARLKGLGSDQSML